MPIANFEWDCSYGEMENLEKELLAKLVPLIGNQSALSRKTGIAQSAISEILSGKRRPYFDQLVEIAKALEVSLDYLVSETTGRPAGYGLTQDEMYILKIARDMELDSSQVNKLIKLGLQKEKQDAAPVEIKHGLPDAPKPKLKKSGG